MNDSFSKDITEHKRAEIALQESEARLRQAQRIAHLGFWEWDILTGDLIWSDESLSILGVKPENFKPTLDSFLTLVHPDDKAYVLSSLDAAIRDNTSYGIEFRALHPDGNIQQLHAQGEVTRDASGKAIRMFGTLMDITAQKQAETTLYRSHRALQVLNECNHTIVHASTGQELINEICRIIVDTGGYRFAWVGYAQSDENKTVYPVASAGYEAGYLDNDFSWDTDRRKFDPVTDVICSGEPSIVKNLSADPSYESLRNAAMERAYRSEIALPLNAGEKAFGALMIYASETDAFDSEEEKLLIRLADDLAYGILSMHSRMERERAEQFLRDSENKYRLLYDENPSIFFTIDKQGTILSINKFGAKELGYTDEELIGSSIFNLSHKAHMADAEEHLQNCLLDPAKTHHWEQQKVCKDGSLLWVRESVRVITDSNGEKIIFMICNDITETHKLSEKLSYQATHDPLTDLINRGEFEKRLRQLLSSTLTDDRQHALCYMDLDQFRLVNENFGHAAGDELLRQLGTVLNRQIRKRDTVARLGDDKFAVLMEHCPLHLAESVTKKIVQAITEYKFLWEDKSHEIGISAGLVPIDKYSGNVAEILMNAATACSVAKQEQDHLHIYHDDEIDYARKHAEAEWVTKIHNALENDYFQLYFQPIVALANNKKDFERYEVLVRMETEQGDIVAPDAFLPVAEKHNLTARIDRWVIDKLFNLLAGLPEQGKSMSLYSINLSGNSLEDRELLEFINQQFENSLIPPEKICFEITETVLIANLSNAMRFIKNLKDRGCFFALDDFGSGFSSFAYLKNLQVDYVKIDGLFIRDIVTNSTDRAIVKSMHEIARTLGKQTVAEYVENADILEILRDIGVDYAQGNYIGEGKPFEQIYRRSSAKIINFSNKRLQMESEK